MEPVRTAIDVAKYQYFIDHGTVYAALRAASPLPVFMAKATQGTSTVDPFFKRNREGSAPLGYSARWWYHWLVPGDDAFIEVQARHWCDTVGYLSLDEGPMCDAEQAGVDEHMTQVWVRKVQELTGRRAIIYTGIFTAGGRIWQDQTLRAWGHCFTIASYTTWAKVQSNNALYGQDQPIHFWQYSGSGRCPGVGRITQGGPMQDLAVDLDMLIDPTVVHRVAERSTLATVNGFTIEPRRKPSSVLPYNNGQMPAAIMQTVEGGGKLAAPTHRKWKALAGLFKKRTGRTLTYTGMYRSYEQQVSLFKSRYSTTPNPGARTEYFEGKWWWLRDGAAGAANPGSSNHGWLVAVDMALDGYASSTWHSLDSQAIVVLKQLIPMVGLSWEGDPNRSSFENWHVHDATGDNVMPAVLAWEAGGIPPYNPDPPQGPVTITPTEDDIADYTYQPPGIANVFAMPSVTPLTGTALQAYQTKGLPNVRDPHLQTVKAATVRNGMTRADWVVQDPAKVDPATLAYINALP